MNPPLAQVSSLADELSQAYVNRIGVQPLSSRYPDLSVADAYAIQEHNAARWASAGDPVVGRKIGLTSAPMQRLLGVSEPDFGALHASMRDEDGDTVAVDRLIAPRIEAELGFVLATDLAGPGVDALRSRAAIAGVAPALELIDSRIADWKITLVDTVADNGSSARFVLAPTLTALDGLDLRTLGCVLSIDGEVVQTGAGAAALGNPLRCVAWLANKLAEFGQHLHAGDVVLSGSLHAAVDIAPGQTIRAEFSRLGAVTVTLANTDGGQQ
jgi:2-keto-4-pentenoate hydratase